MRLQRMATPSSSCSRRLHPAPVRSQLLQATLTGRVEKAPAGACDPKATHRVACTDVLLKSTAVDLKALEGKLMLLAGTFNANPACTTVTVTEAHNPTSTTTVFSLFGYRPGRTVTLTTKVPQGNTESRRDCTARSVR